MDAKKKTLIAREQDADARAAWQQTMGELSAADLVFLDETSTPMTMTPIRSRSPKGQRAAGRVPRGRWDNITLVATLTPTGFGPGLQFAGALDRVTFETFVETTLVPTLRPDQIVILDNLSVHKSARARELIEHAGCQLRFLPTSSPDLNPIEQAFAKLKHRLRQAAARQVDTVLEVTHQLYGSITAEDARGFYRAAGYDL